MNDQEQKIEKWIDRIKLNHAVNSEMEKMRFGILEDIHQRIDAEERTRRFPLKKLYIAASLGLLVALSTWLVYQFDFWHVEQDRVELACPFGVKSTVTLPDGTTVLLNGGTSLAYVSSTFGLKERRVILNGEAFFDVKHNEKVPFIVSSGVTQVKVLGTRFNVEAYHADECVKVTLESGKVCMKIAEAGEECVLVPNQQAIYDKTSHELVRQTVNVNEVVSWRNDEMFFNDTPLEEIVKKLERRFNVHIVIQSEELRKSRYNGAFTAEDDWERILSLFSTMDKRLNFKKENGMILIYQTQITKTK